MEIGYALSSEEHSPAALVEHAVAAESAGFTFALISDHFHPWIDRQGESPFVWSVLGAIAARTTTLRVGTGVTCPLIRMHPAIVAQAAATTAALFGDRFFLGVGTGENLNEHITGERWPAAEIRREMLVEAVAVIRLLWGGELVHHRGRHYTVENGRLYSLPTFLPDIVVAAGGEATAELAAQIGDGFVSTAPERSLVERYEATSGSGPRYGQLTVCYDRSRERALKTALEWWPNAALRGPSSQELPLPSHFEASVAGVTTADISEAIVCGPSAVDILAKAELFAAAGFDHLYIHQVGPDQAGFFEFSKAELLPKLAELSPLQAA